MQPLVRIEIAAERLEREFGTQRPRSAFRSACTDHVRNYSASGTLAQPLGPFREVGDGPETRSAPPGCEDTEQFFTFFTYAFRTVSA